MTGFFEGNSSGGGGATGDGAQVGASLGKTAQVGGVLAGVENMKNGAEQMVDAAKSGGFRADPEGVRELVQVCDRMIEKLRGAQRTFYELAQEPKLGSSPYAKQVAQHVRASADGDQGVIPQVDTFRQVLITLKEALYRASGQYAEAEETAKMRQA